VDGGWFAAESEEAARAIAREVWPQANVFRCSRCLERSGMHLNPVDSGAPQCYSAFAYARSPVWVDNAWTADTQVGRSQAGPVLAETGRRDSGLKLDWKDDVERRSVTSY